MSRVGMGGRLSEYDYDLSKRIDANDYPFYALIAAAMRKADTANSALLQAAWPDVWADLQAMYNGRQATL